MRQGQSTLLRTAGALFVVAALGVGCRSAARIVPGQAYVPAGDWIEQSEYEARRRKLMGLVPDGLAILPGATEVGANFPFRQNNDFLYFTGIEVPGACLVVDGTAGECVLFLDLTEGEARNEGLPPDLVYDARGATGVDDVRPVAELAAYLDAAARRLPVIYTPFRPQELPRVNSLEKHRAWQQSITADPLDGRLTRELQRVARLREMYPGVEVRDCSPLVWALRKIKSPGEIALVRRAAQIAVAGHKELMRATAPGVPEHELAALFEFLCLRAGAEDLAYYTIVMSGRNHPYGHYHRYDRVLADGDFVILDAGPDFAYYDADVSSSFPANGTFSPDQRALYELAEGIHRVCLQTYRPGITLRDVGRRVAEHLLAHGYDPEEPRFAYVTTWGGYNHPIGMATHDVMATMTGPDELLVPGFVFACDINMPFDEVMGIRIEDTVVITADGCEVLSAGLPRSVTEIEKLMSEDGLLQTMERR